MSGRLAPVSSLPRPPGQMGPFTAPSVQQPRWVDLERGGSSPIGRDPVTSPGCGILVLCTILFVALAGAFVAFAIITTNHIDDLQHDVKQLKEAASATATASALPQPAPTSDAKWAARKDIILQRQEALPAPVPPPAPPAVSRAPVAQRPEWATESKPRWLQFETPYDDATVRMPAHGGHKGLVAARQNGFRVECNFGATVVSASPDQVSLDVQLNDETGEEYALVRSLAPAFRGRPCVLEWMA